MKDKRKLFDDLIASYVCCLRTSKRAISLFTRLRDRQINKHQFDLERCYIEAICNLFLQQHKLEKTVSLGVMSSKDGFTDHEADGVTDRGVSQAEQDETQGDGKEFLKVMQSKVEGGNDQDKEPVGHVEKGDKSKEEDEIWIEDTKTCFKDALVHYNYLNEIIRHPMVNGSCKQTKYKKKEMKN